jgi:DNA-binding response OmpR family regulator
MRKVLLVADASWVRNQVRAGLTSNVALVELDDPRRVTEQYREERPDVVVIDMQVDSMGGMAIARALRSAEDSEGWGHVAIVMLLDRSADVFIARRAAADAWLVKPASPQELRRALEAAVSAAVG